MTAATPMHPTRKALIIRHVPYEGVAGFRAPIEDAGFAIERIDVEDPDFSRVDLREPDLLIMMGGPMGVYEQERYPWIACQLRRLAQRIAHDRPTLGVCLGSQMMAQAMGGVVYAGPHKEVGFHAIDLLPAAAASPLRHLDRVPVLHWHGDTFTLPEGVEHLAASPLYPHQAFRRGTNILALQFHAEMGHDPRFEAWLEQGPDAVAEAGLTPAELRRLHDAHGPGAVAAGRAMIGEWLAGLRF